LVKVDNKKEVWETSLPTLRVGWWEENLGGGGRVKTTNPQGDLTSEKGKNTLTSSVGPRGGLKRPNG